MLDFRTVYVGQLVSFNGDLEVVLGIFWDEDYTLGKFLKTESISIFTYKYSKTSLQKEFKDKNLYKRNTRFVEDSGKSIDEQAVMTWLLKSKFQNPELNNIFRGCIFQIQSLILTLNAIYDDYLNYMKDCKVLFKKAYKPFTSATVGRVYTGRHWYI